MPISTPERASRFGCLDETVSADGQPLGAETLRVLALQHNYLVTQGESALSFLFDADTSASSGLGCHQGVATPIWTPLTPELVIPKKPGLDAVELTITIACTGALQVMLSTRGRPFDPTASGGTILDVTSTGALTTFASYEIQVPSPIDADFDVVQVWVKGSPTATLASGGGTPNTGTVTHHGDTIMYSSGATWTVTGTGTSWANAAAVVFRNAGGITIEGHKLITRVPYTDQLEFYPAISAPSGSLVGATYRIETLPQWRLAHVGVYPVENT